MRKKILLLVLFLGFVLVNFALVTIDVLAADNNNAETFRLPFKPAISIPGFSTAGNEFLVDGESLPKYIKAIYRYGGMFAGIVAMFMLVYAGWEWLLAGGNSSKISQAKEKINSTLIGLVILFGGYLLLSLISRNLISFKPLSVELDNIPCALFTTEKTCPVSRCHWEKENTIELNSKSTCLDGATRLATPVCSTQKDSTTCTGFSNICAWESGKCAVKETCNITEAEFELFMDDDAVNSSFNTHCCALSYSAGGFSSYKYAIFGNRDWKLSCHMVCGGGFQERPINECKTSLGWDGAIDGTGGW